MNTVKTLIMEQPMNLTKDMFEDWYDSLIFSEFLTLQI